MIEKSDSKWVSLATVSILGQPPSQPEQRLQDIIDNIDWISSDILDMSIDQFIADRKTQDAVLFCVLRISEAAKKLGD